MDAFIDTILNEYLGDMESFIDTTFTIIRWHGCSFLRQYWPCYYPLDYTYKSVLVTILAYQQYHRYTYTPTPPTTNIDTHTHTDTTPSPQRHITHTHSDTQTYTPTPNHIHWYTNMWCVHTVTHTHSDTQWHTHTHTVSPY